MPKDERTINGAVRIGEKVFKAGEEDEFQAAASEAQITRLTEKGVIAGFGQTLKTEPPKDKK